MPAISITLKKSADKKHSVRFDAPKDAVDPIITSIYVARPTADKWSEVTVTLEGK